MSHTFEAGKDAIIDTLIERINQKMSESEAALCRAFIQQFFGTVALDDLAEWNPDDLYGAAVNLWRLVEDRKAGEMRIRIYNPDYERHNWSLSHTVVEVVCKDMPFLVDTMRLAINRMGIASHLIVHMGGLSIKRNKDGKILEVLPRHSKDSAGVVSEAVVMMEIDRISDPLVLEEMHHNFERVFEDNRVVVEDWLAMRQKVCEAIDELGSLPSTISADEVQETHAFLKWIEDHHFTFLGVRDYELVEKGKETVLQALPESGLGVLRPDLSKSSARSISAMTPEARELTLSSRILVMSKTNTLASVHRDAYTDYIGIKRFNKKGQVIGERRIIGLYTSAAYNTNPKHIPFLRRKVSLIMKRSGMHAHSHGGKVLMNILETMPRDDLIQGTEDEILEIAMGIFYMQERRRIRMFARKDIYHRFVSCLVYVPRERFNTELRQAMQKILHDCFNAKEITFSTRFSESVLARIHFIIRTDPKDFPEVDYKDIEKKLIEVGRSWSDDLSYYLGETFGEERGNQFYAMYKNAFPAAYTENFTPRTAVFDIKHLDDVSEAKPLGIHFYQYLDEQQDQFRLKLYQHHQPIVLSDVLPILERMGLRVISERPFKLKRDNGTVSWISDFALEQRHGEMKFDIDTLQSLFDDAFAAAWFGDAENDGFNMLVLGAGLNWRQVSILRAYARFFKQIGITFSQDYIEAALHNNASLSKKLVHLFEIRFQPSYQGSREDDFNALVSELLTDLDAVANLDEDKIIRQYIQTISSTLRTNYYQQDANHQYKPYISMKFKSNTIPGMPKPYPMYEIFVYSPRFEGVHLRCGKVARGGLRWSDRKEDFRTEILGLMKAQQVKNAVIVPTGAKGGFVPKKMPTNPSREEFMAEGIACYRLFIRGLLDITDNYHEGVLVPPQDVVRFDEDDPYLVVAADKGTATFSDIANEISQEYQFWLGDAFASGGSAGYDHKKMGITAKGAWESVKRHFFEMNVDISKNTFSVVGIGDMSGDVFGNGMLLSKNILLIAAFNHQHIFIDPHPDALKTFEERKRLFNLPRSAWTDFDASLISKGGGVFNRNAKSIKVSKEMKEVFGLSQSEIEPNELIKAILKSEFDLLWSAGIGTFVKASRETHADVGDKTNDGIRINAQDLNCKIVGEGGNLGMTQLARIEYSMKGGLVYTDFIDNSAGVSCSDKEVNIKILLDSIMRAGDMTLKQRNELLAKMTDEVAKLVLRENFAQTRAISLAASTALRNIELHSRYMTLLEKQGKLDRALEFLPDDKDLAERKNIGKGLGRPSLSVLLAYSKTILKEQILASNVPEDEFLKPILLSAFPVPLREHYAKEMQEHRLKREIIATRLSNIIVNEMGFTFIYRLQDETGAMACDIVRAYIITRTILGMEQTWRTIDELGTSVSSKEQADMMLLYVRLCRRLARWFLRNRRTALDISQNVALYQSGMEELKKALPDILGPSNREQYDRHFNRYLELSVPKALAHELAVTRALFAATDIIDVARESGQSVKEVARLYFTVGEYLDLAWIRGQIIIHPTDNQWEGLSREALRDDLDLQQRQLTYGIIQFNGHKKNFTKAMEVWQQRNAELIERWRQILVDLRAGSSMNYTMFFVAIRELLDLTQTTIQMAKEHEPAS